MKARKLAIWPWLSCPYNKNTLVDLPSSVQGMRQHGCRGCTNPQIFGISLLHLQILRHRAVSFPHVVQISCRKLGYSSCHFKTRHDKMNTDQTTYCVQTIQVSLPTSSQTSRKCLLSNQEFIREGQTETAIILCKLNKSL